MRMAHKLYYRMHGVRYSESLLRPPTFEFDQLPRFSLYHYLPDDLNAPNVDASLPIFQGYQKKISLEYVKDYVEKNGPCRRIVLNLKEVTRPWRKENRAKWIETNQEWLNNQNPESLIVVDYGYLDHMYRYQPVKLAHYYRWENRQRTLYTTINQIASQCDRNQFLIYRTPTLLQGRTILDKFGKEPVTLRTESVFGQDGEAGYWQLDLWRWMSDEFRSKSLLNLIQPKYYCKINLVFHVKTGGHVLINLAYFEAWIKGHENTTDYASLIQHPYKQLQLFGLKFQMFLNALTVDEEEGGGVATHKTQEIQELETEANTSAATVSVSKEPSRRFNEEDTETDLDDLPDDELTGKTKSLFVSQVAPKGDVKTIDGRGQRELDATGNVVIRQRPNLERRLLSSLEEDIKLLDRISLSQLRNKKISLDSDNLHQETTEKPEVVKINPEEVRQELFTARNPADVFRERLLADTEERLLTPGEFRKFAHYQKEYREGVSPYDDKTPRMEAMTIQPGELDIKPETIMIKDSPGIPDKTMLQSSLKTMTKQYVKTTMKKDILRALDAIQGTGVSIRYHDVEIGHSALGSYETHTLELAPLDGRESTVRFTLPVVDEEGVFMAGNSRYILRRQRIDAPIRKIGPQTVGLSSYYGKTFVQLSPKAVNNSLRWINNKVNSSIIEQSSLIQNVVPGDVFDHDFKGPRLYNALASEFDSFSVGDIQLFFDHTKRQARVNPELLKIIEKNGRVWCGWMPDKRPVVIDKHDRFFAISKKEEVSLGDVYDFFKLPIEKAPLDYAEVRVFSKYIPIGLVIAYFIGFDKLLALLGTPYRVVEARKQKELLPTEYAVSFKDQSLIFDRKDEKSNLILAGFLDFASQLKQFERTEFDKKDVYLNLFMSKKMTAIYVKELEMMNDAFIDPITREILAKLGEPTTFQGLLMRSVDLLLTYDHPASQDRSVMRDRGYERFAGTIYKELMFAIRSYKSRNYSGRSKIDISPYQIWNAIMKDSSLKIVEDINPLQNLKESEVVTYSGTGGRDTESMTKPTRQYLQSDIGITSEANVDNTAVGTVVYLSANPQIGDVRGMASTEKVLNPTSMLSTTTLVAPAIMSDSPKRISFSNKQATHIIASDAYRQPMVRTGYEFVVAHRTGKMFCTTAEEDGEVTEHNDRGMIVTYKSGEQSGIELGRVYGKAEGSVYPQDIVSPLNVGDKFKKDSILAYNTKFFEPDFLDPKSVLLKNDVLVRTVFQETNENHDDSCTLSQQFCNRLTTESTKIKSWIVDFVKEIKDLKKPGEEVHPRDVLMIIEDEITAATEFGEQSLEALKRLAAVSPRANMAGTIEKIEIFYNGHKDDMSPSLKRLADKSDSEMIASCKASNKPPVNGRVTSEYRVRGTALEQDRAEIRIYITKKSETGVGDKTVFGHQMKCTVSEVKTGGMFTEEGQQIDATFAFKAMVDRQVMSATILGTTMTIMDEGLKQAIKLYDGVSA